MLTIKVAYNSKTESQISFIKGYPDLEAYSEDDYRERKKALSLKASCGAKQLPFIAFYHNGELIKALYSEVGECNADNIFSFLQDYVNTHANKGWISVQKIEGSNNEYIPIGEQYSGYTNRFMEGFSCQIRSTDTWFRSSNIVSIDWENGEFKTLNSTYKFEFTPDKDSDNP